LQMIKVTMIQTHALIEKVHIQYRELKNSNFFYKGDYIL